MRTPGYLYEKSSRRVRLSANAIKVVKEKAKEVFGKDVRVVLFGSRVNEKARGGAIAMIDIVNLLERIGINIDSDKWFELREIRNSRSHWH